MDKPKAAVQQFIQSGDSSAERNLARNYADHAAHAQLCAEHMAQDAQDPDYFISEDAIASAVSYAAHMARIAKDLEETL
jgi:ATP:corrinoid adenosyltransferase